MGQREQPGPRGLEVRNQFHERVTFRVPGSSSGVREHDGRLHTQVTWHFEESR